MGFPWWIGVRFVAWALSALTVLSPAAGGPSGPRSALPVELAGVMVNRADAARSVCLIHCLYPTPHAERYRAGQSVCDLAEVQSITRDGVVVRNLLTGRFETLLLPEAGSVVAGALPASPAPVAKLVVASPDRVTVDLSQGMVDYYMNNLPEVLESALASPRYRPASDGQRTIDGYEIGNIKDNGVAGQLGLQNGDIVVAVNGQPLGDLPSIVRMAGQVQTASQINVTVLRKGQQVTYVFNRR